MKVTPLAIEMLIHFVCTVAPWPRQNAPACQEMREWFVEMGLLEVVADDRWNAKATPRAHAWLDLICETPLPEQRWVDPRIEKGGEDE